MTDITPFRALRYDPEKVALADALVPPYDVVQPEERPLYYDRSPYNAIRLTLTRNADDEASTDYREVREVLEQWQREAVLRFDDAPALYVLRQRFTSPSGEPLTRTGFFGAVRLEDYANRVVLPHERTLSRPKADRLKLLRATEANLSSVFFLYEDKEEAIAAALDAAFATDTPLCAEDAGGVLHEIAPLRDAAATALIRGFLSDREVVIADGHHRYETALAYREEQRGRGARRAAQAEAPWDRMLGYFTNAYAPGSLLLPIHRVVPGGSAPSAAEWRARLPRWAMREVRRERRSIEEILDAVLAPVSDRPSFVADDGGEVLRVFSRPRESELAIRLIHSEVIGGVFGLDDEAVRDGAVVFKKSAEVAERAVRQEGAACALYLNALTPDDVFRVTRAGEILPQKSTFFTPKLPAGLLFRSHLEPR